MTTEASETLYVGNLDPLVTEVLLYELFLQVAPVKAVRFPKDKVSRQHQGFGFVNFHSKMSAQYALQAFQGVSLYNRILKLGKVNGQSQESAASNTLQDDEIDETGFDLDDDFGPVVFVGNLDPFVDTTTLRDTFSLFGKLRKPVELVKGQLSNHAFLTFQTFEEADKALEQMNRKMIMNRPVKIEYAYKRGSTSERHGDSIERTLWEKAKQNNFIGREGEKKAILDNLKKDKDVNGTSINTKGELSIKTNTKSPIPEYPPSARGLRDVGRNSPPSQQQQQNTFYSNQGKRNTYNYNGGYNNQPRFNTYNNNQDARFQPYPQYQGQPSRGNYNSQRGSYRGRGRNGYNNRGRGGRGGYQTQRDGYHKNGQYYG